MKQKELSIKNAQKIYRANPELLCYLPYTEEELTKKPEPPTLCGILLNFMREFETPEEMKRGLFEEVEKLDLSEEEKQQRKKTIEEELEKL